MPTLADLVREAYSRWNDAETLSRCGRDLHDRNRLDLSREVLARALELEPGDLDAWAHLAYAHMRDYEPEKGFEILRKGIERTGSDRLKATLAGFTPDKEERARLLEEVRGNDEPAVRASSASVRHSAGDPEAFAELRRVVEENPDDADVRETWLWAILDSRWRGGAKEVDIQGAVVPLVDRMIAERPARCMGYWLKAHLLVADGKWEGARAAADEALARFPDEETMMFVRGRSFKETGDLDRAAECFARAIGMKPSFAGARRELGKVYEAQGRLDLAEEVFREIPRANPRYGAGPVSLALFLGRRDRWEEAERVFLEAWGRLSPWQKARLKPQPDLAPLLARPRIKAALG